jgi:hypothetical protein
MKTLLLTLTLGLVLFTSPAWADTAVLATDDFHRGDDADLVANWTNYIRHTFGRLDLSWTASTDDVAVLDYWVERCAGVGCASFSPVTSLVGTVLADTGLAPSTSYTYRVKARDTSGNFSGYSSEVSAITAPVNFHLSLNLRRVSTDPAWMLPKECLDILAQEPVAPKPPLSMTAGQWREFEYTWMKWCNRKQDAC